MEPVALSTPYALRHCQKQKAGVLPGSRPGVDIKMELDVKAIGEMLRGVAPEVFDELERQSSLATLNLDMENLLNCSNDQPMLVGSSDPRESIDGESTSQATLNKNGEQVESNSTDHHWTNTLNCGVLIYHSIDSQFCISFTILHRSRHEGLT